MNTLVMSRPRLSTVVSAREHVRSTDFTKSPAVYRRKSSAVEGTRFTLEDSQGALTETSRELRYPFYLPQGSQFENIRLVQQLPVVLEHDDDGTYVLSDEVFDRFGSGGSPQSAYTDLMEDLGIYYEIIAESAVEDYPAARALFEHLQQYIQRTDE